MSRLEKLKDKAKGLEAKDPRGAIEAWLGVLQAQEQEGEPNPDLSVFNRVGDLYLKVKDPAQAADYYDRAVDKYAELGFHNNALAMCNKVLRNAPARPTTYLKLAKLYAAKGFLDVDAPPGARGRPVAPPPHAPRAPPPAPAPLPEPEPEVETLAQSLVESVTPEPDTSLEIESTNLADEVAMPGGEGNGGGALL